MQAIEKQMHVKFVKSKMHPSHVIPESTWKPNLDCVLDTDKHVNLI